MIRLSSLIFVSFALCNSLALGQNDNERHLLSAVFRPEMVEKAPTPTAPTPPTAPTSRVRLPKPFPRPLLIRKCPKKFSSRVRCAIPLKCNYNPVKCCDRKIYTKRCSCTRSSQFRCASVAIRCAPCNKPPRVISSCPDKRPKDNVYLCKKNLRCAYPGTILCECRYKKKLTCRPIRPPVRTISSCPERPILRSQVIVLPICANVDRLECAYEELGYKCFCTEGKAFECFGRGLPIDPVPPTLEHRRWPELVGKTCEEASASIKRVFPQATRVICVIPGQAMDKRYDLKRVQIPVDELFMVKSAPFTG